MRKIYMVSISMLLFSILLGGCAGDSSSKEAIRSLISSVDMDPAYLGGDKEAPLEKIKKMVADHDEIYDVAVVQKGKQILVAYKVKHMKRFKMASIDKDLTSDLNKKFKGYEIVISSDIKIFLEVVELIVQVQDKGYSKEKAKKWFGKIMDLEKEMT